MKALQDAKSMAMPMMQRTRLTVFTGIAFITRYAKMKKFTLM
jgi:hypothetical protein